MAAGDPGADFRLVGGCGPLRRRLAGDVADLQRQAQGRVLDLQGPLAGGFAYRGHEELVVASPTALDVYAGATFDTVCSFGALAAAPDLPALLGDLLGLMHPESRILFVEPDGDARRSRRRLDGAARRCWGVSLARDISGALWNGGFELCSLQRRPVRIAGLPLVRIVVGAARPALVEPDREST